MKYLSCMIVLLLLASCSGEARPVLTSQENHQRMNKVYISTQNEENLIPFHNDAGKWGYLDAQADTVVISPKYDRANLFENGIAKVFINNPKATSYQDAHLIGFINTRGDEIFAPQFTGVYDVEIHGKQVDEKELAYLKTVYLNDGTKGVIELTTGQWILKLQEDERIAFYDRHHFVVGHRVFYANGQKLQMPEGLRIERVDFSPNFLWVKNKNEATGLYTWKGKQIIPAKYLDLEYNIEARRIVANGLKGGMTLGNIKRIFKLGKENADNVKVDLYNFSGRKITSYRSRYQATINDDSTGSFQRGNKTIYFNLKDGEIVQMKASVVDTIDHQFVLFERNDLEGLRTLSGKEIIPPVYRTIQYINSNLIVAQTPQITYQVFDSKGNRVFSKIYGGLIYLPKLQRFMASYDGKSGQIDLQENVVIPLEYSGFSSLSLVEEPPYAVSKDHKNGIIDGNGKTIVPFIYDDITDSRVRANTKNPYFIVKKDEYYGLMNARGEWLLPPEYGYISMNEDDVKNRWVGLEAYPRSKDLSGLYNLKTGVLISTKYSSVSAYDDFIIVANRKNNQYFHQLMDLQGTPLTDNSYTKMEYTHGYLLCEKNGTYGILNTKGEPIIPFDYQRITPVISTLLRVEQNGDYFYMSIDGKQYKAPKK